MKNVTSSSLTSNYREIIEENNSSFKKVIVSYFLLYLIIGLIYDFFRIFFFNKPIKLNKPCEFCVHTFKDIIVGLFNFKYTPIITIFFISVAIISLIVARLSYIYLLFHDVKHKKISTENTSNDVDNLERILLNIVEEMKIASMLNYLPEVFVYYQDTPNCFSLTTSKSSGIIGVSEGAISLHRDLLTAMIAHEFGHLKCEDSKVAYYVDFLSNSLYFLVEMLFEYFAFMFDILRRFIIGKNSAYHVFVILFFWALTWVLKIFIPVVTNILNSFLKDSSDFRADALAIKYTRNTLALNQILQKQYDCDFDIYLRNSSRYHSSFFSGDNSDKNEWFIYNRNKQTLLKRRLNNTFKELNDTEEEN